MVDEADAGRREPIKDLRDLGAAFGLPPPRIDPPRASESARSRIARLPIEERLVYCRGNEFKRLPPGEKDAIKADAIRNVLEMDQERGDISVVAIRREEVSEEDAILAQEPFLIRDTIYITFPDASTSKGASFISMSDELIRIYHSDLPADFADRYIADIRIERDLDRQRRLFRTIKQIDAEIREEKGKPAKEQGRVVLTAREINTYGIPREETTRAGWLNFLKTIAILSFLQVSDRLMKDQHLQLGLFQLINEGGKYHRKLLMWEAAEADILSRLLNRDISPRAIDHSVPRSKDTYINLTLLGKGFQEYEDTPAAVRARLSMYMIVAHELYDTLWRFEETRGAMQEWSRGGR